MTFRRLIKLVRAYPYLLNDTYVRSSSEADALFRDFAPSLGETVARAKARADLPQEAWAYLESLAERIDRKNERKQRIKAVLNHFGERLRLHRRLVAVGVVLILLLAYFTLVPSGRTIAKDIFERMFTIVGNNIRIQDIGYLENDQVRNDAQIDSFYEVTTEYATIESYIEATGIVPFTLNSRKVSCEAISEYVSSAEGRRLWTDYSIGNDGIITVRQEWITIENETAYHNVENSIPIVLRSGEPFIYYIDEKDHSFNGTAVLNDGSILYIYINKEVYFEDVIRIIEK